MTLCCYLNVITQPEVEKVCELKTNRLVTPGWNTLANNSVVTFCGGHRGSMQRQHVCFLCVTAPTVKRIFCCQLVLKSIMQTLIVLAVPVHVC